MPYNASKSKRRRIRWIDYLKRILGHFKSPVILTKPPEPQETITFIPAKSLKERYDEAHTIDDFLHN